MSATSGTVSPATPTAIQAAVFDCIALDRLERSPLNPRNPIRRDDPKTIELSKSIAGMGVIEPIVVRACNDKTFQILAGERRWVASQMAKRPDIECKIVSCDDRTALQITVVENLQRENLSPLEEARGVQSLLDAGYSPAEVCAELGKTASWVALRAQLTQLSDGWRKALAAGELAWATVAHLEQIARLPADIQDELRKDLEEYNEWDRPPSAAALGKDIANRFLHVLKSAPWKQDDPELVPAAGACSVCPKRSDLQQVLFADHMKGGVRCLDGVCWRTKLGAITCRHAIALQAEHDQVVVLTSDRPTAPSFTGVDLPKGVSQVPDGYQVARVVKSTPGAMPAIDSATGQQVWVTSSDSSSPEVRKVLGAPPQEKGAGRRPASTEDTKAVEANRRRAKRFGLRCKAIGIAADTAKRPALAHLLRLVRFLLVERFHRGLFSAKTWTSIGNPKGGQDQDLDALWGHVRDMLPSEYSSRFVSTELPDLAAIEAMEELVGLDPQAQAILAQGAIPEPSAKPKAKLAPKGHQAGSGKVAKPKAARKAKRRKGAA